jgi:hypothetical protein
MADRRHGLVGIIVEALRIDHEPADRNRSSLAGEMSNSSADQIHQVVEGHLSLDALTRKAIHETFEFTFAATSSGDKLRLLKESRDAKASRTRNAAESLLARASRSKL